ncbi:MAG: hypothetical protein HY815_11120 [Candidatus Riflebacteria bacterium]|nr:hypothetical protein [Candidatus Riflebacteria bacterium]
MNSAGAVPIAPPMNSASGLPPSSLSAASLQYTSAAAPSVIWLDPYWVMIPFFASK